MYKQWNKPAILAGYPARIAAMRPIVDHYPQVK
jgi:hypothetical protein